MDQRTLIEDLDARQDEVIARLDELNARLESLLGTCLAARDQELRGGDDDGAAPRQRAANS
jgi:hypothetical protein